MYHNLTRPFRPIIFLIILTLNISTNLFSQSLSGKITDKGGSPIPFASIFVKETSMGTSANGDGLFELNLPKTGNYEIAFQAMGFEKKTMQFAFTDARHQTQDIVLTEYAYQLAPVDVYSGNEDPGMRIMRKAIALAPYHQKQVSDYQSEVYLKGSLLVKKMPALFAKHIFVDNSPPKVGERYTAESINQITFVQPNQYTHKVISSRSTFPQSDQGQNPIGYITATLYQPNIDEIISPFSPQAFSHYKFVYEGCFYEGNLTINKIKVVAKRNSPQLLNGHLYIVDGLWCIHSADLTNEAFWGSIQIKQVYTPVRENIWMPSTHHFNIEAAIMGIKAEVEYAGSVKYLSVSPNTNLATPSLVQRPTPLEEAPAKTSLNKNQQKIEEISAKENLTRSDMVKLVRLMAKEEKKSTPKDTSLLIDNNYKVKFEKDTLKRDTAFWNAMRPIPLSQSEVQSFKAKDSVEVSKLAIVDTTKAQPNKKASPFKTVLGGYHFTNPDTTFKANWDGLLGFDKLGFNPVDGFWYKQTARFEFRPNKTNEVRIEPMVKYAFGSKTLLGALSTNWSHSPMKRGEVWLTASANSEDFSRVGTSVLVNTASNLFFKTNHIQQYQHNHLRAGQQIDMANGLQLTTEVGYSRFLELENSTDFSVIDPNKPYPSNKPTNALGNIDQHLQSQNELATWVKLRYTPKFRYRIDKGKKVMVHSYWPTFEAGWQQAYVTPSSDARFSHLWLTVTQKQDLGPLSAIDYTFSAGKSLNASDMHFSSFKSFANVSPTVEIKPLGQRFALLDNYKYSTNQQYAELHFNYSNSLLLLKRLPFLSNRLWNENLYFHGLSQPQLTNHMEIGYGLSQLFLAGEAAVVAGFDKFGYTGWAIKLSWGF
jgi:hypothetical protein